MKCLCCGGDDLVRDTRAVPVKGGEPMTLTGDFCPDCGEVILDRIEGDRYMAALKEARQKPAQPVAGSPLKRASL